LIIPLKKETERYGAGLLQSSTGTLSSCRGDGQDPLEITANEWGLIYWNPGAPPQVTNLLSLEPGVLAPLAVFRYKLNVRKREEQPKIDEVFYLKRVAGN
jgi:hypothetical protein